MEKKCGFLASILALALGIGVAGCDPGSDSVEDSQRTGSSAGSEDVKPEGLIDDDTFGDEGIVDDDTFGGEGVVDDDTFGEEGIVDDDL